MSTLQDRINALASAAAALDERLQKAMRSRGIDGDGDGVYNEGMKPASGKPKRSPLKKPKKPQQPASNAPGTGQQAEARPARGAARRPAAQAPANQPAGDRSEV